MNSVVFMFRSYSEESNSDFWGGESQVSDFWGGSQVSYFFGGSQVSDFLGGSQVSDFQGGSPLSVKGKILDTRFGLIHVQTGKKIFFPRDPP